MQIVLTREEPDDELVLRLSEEQQAELADLYGEEHTPLAVQHDIAFVVAWAGDEAVGCAGLQPLEPGVGELKRMYVKPEARGRGLSRLLLAEVERMAAERGMTVLRLETGNRQLAAVALYRASGYRQIPRFGKYVDWPLSLCFEKTLASPAEAPATRPAEPQPSRF